MNISKTFIIIFTGYALFWNLGAKPLAEWDESRYGQIALEMLRGCESKCDLVNYYYNGEPEFWTAKPPLSIWAIVLSYKVFGFNEFALRLPAAMAGLVALCFLILFFRLYLTETYSWWAIGVAVTTKALIGPHIARSGDTDAFLVAGLFGFLFYFCRFFKEEKQWDLVRAGILLGLAFFAKAFAIGFFFPVGVYLLFWKSGWRKLIFNKFFYVGAVAFLSVPIAWLTVVSLYGNKDPSNQFGGNAIEVMIFFDVLGRLTGAIDSGRSGIDWGFLPRAMEIRFGVWWILLCIWGVFLLFGKSRSKKTLVFVSETARKDAVVLASVGFGSLMILFFVSVVKLDWYLAPLLPFFCVLLFYGYERVLGVYPRIARALIVAAAVFAISNQVRYVSLDGTHSQFRDFVASRKDLFRSAERILPNRRLTQDEMLYVAWNHPKPIAKVVTQEADHSDKPDRFELECREGDCRLLVP